MEQDDLLRHAVRVLEALGLPYLVTGSIATILYGEPRFTNDIDIVVQLDLERVPGFVAAFPAPDFYVDEERVRSAVRARSQFNVIHPHSGLKIDVIVPEMNAFDLSRFARRHRARAANDLEAHFAAPEDVIVKKLEYFATGGSDKHLRDIGGVLRVSGEHVDRRYVEDWARRLGLEDTWELVRGDQD